MTGPDALAKMRGFCLSLPDTSERPHFGQAMFYVGRRGLASCGEKDGIWEIVVQLEPEHATALVKSDPRFQRYPRAKDCVSVDVSRVAWSEVKTLVQASYERAQSGPGARPAARARRKKQPPRPPP